MQPRELADAIVAILDDRKAVDLVMLDVHHLTIIADYFIICSGRSQLQVRALCDHVDEEIGKHGIAPSRVDGREAAEWVVMDYGSVILHVFTEQQRQYYNLERLWTDGSNAVELPVHE